MASTCPDRDAVLSQHSSDPLLNAAKRSATGDAKSSPATAATPASATEAPVQTPDEQVKAVGKDDGAARRLPFVEHAPAEDPVDPAQLLSEIAAEIKKYIVVEPEQADAAALWVAHTYLTEAADISPILVINAPERACAKTLLQTLLGRICYRSLPASNASLSALFRSIESWAPTLLIDEADTFFGANSELQGMVNAGYKRGGYVLRSESTGNSFEPRMFAVYGAKSVAGIALEKHLPDSTMSRGILINMRRKLPHEKVDRMREANGGVLDRLASQAARFANDYSQQIRAARPELPDDLTDRAQDNWEPLLAIAMSAGEEWVKRATRAALKLSAANDEHESTSNNLLADIREVLEQWSKPTIRSVALIEKLVADPDMGWLTYNRGNQLTPRQLAKNLATYGIKPKTVRQRDGSTPKGYDLAAFEDAFTRYLKPAPTVPPAPPDLEPDDDSDDSLY